MSSEASLEEEEAAAIKLQSLYRGRLARRAPPPPPPSSLDYSHLPLSALPEPVWTYWHGWSGEAEALEDRSARDPVREALVCRRGVLGGGGGGALFAPPAPDAISVTGAVDPAGEVSLVFEYPGGAGVVNFNGTLVQAAPEGSVLEIEALFFVCCFGGGFFFRRFNFFISIGPPFCCHCSVVCTRHEYLPVVFN
jgi:hypothetical protein